MQVSVALGSNQRHVGMFYFKYKLFWFDALVGGVGRSSGGSGGGGGVGEGAVAEAVVVVVF